MTNGKVNKIVLVYSGGLDTSVMLRWLRDKYQCEVVCYCADVGQGAEMDGLEEKAKATGGSKIYIEDLREEFVRDYVWTSVKANAVYEGVYLMGTSLARPMMRMRPSSSCCSPIGGTATPMSIWPDRTCVSVAVWPPVAVGLALLPVCLRIASRCPSRTSK